MLEKKCLQVREPIAKRIYWKQDIFIGENILQFNLRFKPKKRGNTDEMKIFSWNCNLQFLYAVAYNLTQIRFNKFWRQNFSNFGFSCEMKVSSLKVCQNSKNKKQISPGKSCWPIMAMAALSCFCIPEGDFSISSTMPFLTESLSEPWILSPPSSVWKKK